LQKYPFLAKKRREERALLSSLCLREEVEEVGFTERIELWIEKPLVNRDRTPGDGCMTLALIWLGVSYPDYLKCRSCFHSFQNTMHLTKQSILPLPASQTNSIFFLGTG
jgi:hypothetical protein